MLAAVALLASAQSSALKEYQPDPQIALKGEMLSPSEHNRRSGALGDKLYVLHWKIGGGEVLFVGARHVYDPESPDNALIQGLWEKFLPTIAFAEGRNTTVAKTIEEGVKTHAEVAVTTVLARDAEVPLYTWEPSKEQEFAGAKRLHGEKATLAFLFLRGYYGNRRTSPVSDATASLVLARRQAEYGFGRVFANLAEFDDYWKADFAALGEWRTAEERVLWPGEDRTVLNKIANLANAARDAHLLRCIIDACNKGNRVWVTAGRSHVINQEPVLFESASPQELPLTTKRPWS